MSMPLSNSLLHGHKNTPLSPFIIASHQAVRVIGGANRAGGNLMLLILPTYCMPMCIPSRLSMCTIKIHRSLSPLNIGPKKKYFVCLLSVCIDLPDVTVHTPLRTLVLYHSVLYRFSVFIEFSFAPS